MPYRIYLVDQEDTPTTAGFVTKSDEADAITAARLSLIGSREDRVCIEGNAFYRYYQLDKRGYLEQLSTVEKGGARERREQAGLWRGE